MRLTLALLRRFVRRPHQPPEWEIAEETKKFANLPEKFMQDVKRGVSSALVLLNRLSIDLRGLKSSLIIPQFCNPNNCFVMIMYLWQVYYRTPRGISYRPKELRLFKNYIGVNRIWSYEAAKEIGDAPFIPWVEPLRDWFFFKGDRVSFLHALISVLNLTHFNGF